MKLEHKPAAPRERGWTPKTETILSFQRGCPARAGMDRGHLAGRLKTRWLPRASGAASATRRFKGFAIGLPRASGDGPESITDPPTGWTAASHEWLN